MPSRSARSPVSDYCPQSIKNYPATQYHSLSPKRQSQSSSGYGQAATARTNYVPKPYKDPKPSDHLFKNNLRSPSPGRRSPSSPGGGGKLAAYPTRGVSPNSRTNVGMGQQQPFMSFSPPSSMAGHGFARERFIHQKHEYKAPVQQFETGRSPTRAHSSPPDRTLTQGPIGRSPRPAGAFSSDDRPRTPGHSNHVSFKPLSPPSFSFEAALPVPAAAAAAGGGNYTSSASWGGGRAEAGAEMMRNGVPAFHLSSSSTAAASSPARDEAASASTRADYIQKSIDHLRRENDARMASESAAARIGSLSAASSHSAAAAALSAQAASDEHEVRARAQDLATATAIEAQRQHHLRLASMQTAATPQELRAVNFLAAQNASAANAAAAQARVGSALSASYPPPVPVLSAAGSPFSLHPPAGVFLPSTLDSSHNSTLSSSAAAYGILDGSALHPLIATRVSAVDHMHAPIHFPSPALNMLNSSAVAYASAAIAANVAAAGGSVIMSPSKADYLAAAGSPVAAMLPGPSAAVVSTQSAAGTGVPSSGLIEADMSVGEHISTLEVQNQALQDRIARLEASLQGGN